MFSDNFSLKFGLDYRSKHSFVTKEKKKKKLDKTQVTKQ